MLARVQMIFQFKYIRKMALTASYIGVKPLSRGSFKLIHLHVHNGIGYLEQIFIYFLLVSQLRYNENVQLML